MVNTKSTLKKPLDLLIQQSFIIQAVIFYLSIAVQFIKNFLGLNTKKTTEKGLFPPNSNIQTCQAKGLKECSTQLGTRLVPVRNPNGEIEWKFVEDGSQQQQQHQSNTNFNIPSTEFFDEQLAKIESQKKNHHQAFSPISESSQDFNVENNNNNYNNNLKMSFPQQQQVKTKKLQLASPASSTLSPPTNDKSVVDLSPQTSNKSNSSLENEMMLKSDEDEELDDDEEEEEEDEVDENGVKIGKKKHTCPYCSANFRIRGYLTRHMKKHSSEKAYKCPFYTLKSSHKCHATGGFSRRDTYKTHLKSRHFKYPSGTKSANRTGMIGWCGLCGQSFANNEIWVETHVESGECSGLPNTYQKRDSKKKKTGKRSHLLDVVSTHTPPPLDLKKSSPSSSNSSYSSPTSISFQNQQSTYHHNIKLENHSPISSTYSPSPSLIPASSQQQPQKQQTTVKNSNNLDAFYYKPTQYETIPYGSNNTNSKEVEEDFAPMDDGFYHIKEAHFSHVFDACRSQFPDYGI